MILEVLALTDPWVMLVTAYNTPTMALVKFSFRSLPLREVKCDSCVLHHPRTFAGRNRFASFLFHHHSAGPGGLSVLPESRLKRYYFHRKIAHCGGSILRPGLEIQKCRFPVEDEGWYPSTNGRMKRRRVRRKKKRLETADVLPRVEKS